MIISKDGLPKESTPLSIKVENSGERAFIKPSLIISKYPSSNDPVALTLNATKSACILPLGKRSPILKKLSLKLYLKDSEIIIQNWMAFMRRLELKTQS